MCFNFCESFFRITAKEDLELPRALWVLSTPTYKFHPKDPLEVDAIPLGCLIAEFARIMSALLRNKKRKIMVGVEFVLFFFTEIAHGGESWTIAVLG